MITDRMQANMLLHVTDRLKEAKCKARDLDEVETPKRMQVHDRQDWKREHAEQVALVEKEIELLEWFIELIDDNASEACAECGSPATHQCVQLVEPHATLNLCSECTEGKDDWTCNSYASLDDYLNHLTGRAGNDRT